MLELIYVCVMVKITLTVSVGDDHGINDGAGTFLMYTPSKAP